MSEIFLSGDTKGHALFGCTKHIIRPYVGVTRFAFFQQSIGNLWELLGVLWTPPICHGFCLCMLSSHLVGVLKYFEPKEPLLH